MRAEESRLFNRWPVVDVGEAAAWCLPPLALGLQAGRVVQADVLKEESGRSKGCGIVEFSHPVPPNPPRSKDLPIQCVEAPLCCGPCAVVHLTHFRTVCSFAFILRLFICLFLVFRRLGGGRGFLRAPPARGRARGLRADGHLVSRPPNLREGGPHRFSARLPRQRTARRDFSTGVRRQHPVRHDGGVALQLHGQGEEPTPHTYTSEQRAWDANSRSEPFWRAGNQAKTFAHDPVRLMPVRFMQPTTT